jgi:hypothetical protein
LILEAWICPVVDALVVVPSLVFLLYCYFNDLFDQMLFVVPFILSVLKLFIGCSDISDVFVECLFFHYAFD